VRTRLFRYWPYICAGGPRSEINLTCDCLFFDYVDSVLIHLATTYLECEWNPTETARV